MAVWLKAVGRSLSAANGVLLNRPARLDTHKHAHRADAEAPESHRATDSSYPSAAGVSMTACCSHPA